MINSRSGALLWQNGGYMATTITVSSTAALYDALAHAKGGEVIQLAAGDYGTLALSAKSGFNVTFPSNVTITSADPLHPASFSGLALSNVSNLTLDSVVYDYTFKPGDPLSKAPFSIMGGDHVTITNSTFDGDVASGGSVADNGYGTGYGLMVRGATNVTFSNNEMTNFHRGLVVNSSVGVTVSGNDISAMRSDGMDFAQVKGVLIEGNTIHDFRGSPTSLDHPDMIQFWTTGTTAASTDIVIRGNVLDIGTGTPTQSIFMRNELVDLGKAGTAMNYQNVTIEQNVITNAHLNGIVVGQTTGLTIQHNSVLHADGGAVDGADASVEIPAISIAQSATAVSVTNNATSAVYGWTGQTGWTVSQNAFVQDQNPGAPGYYANVFVSSSLTPSDGLHDFLALPGGMLDALDAGADATLSYVPEPGEVHAVFQATADQGGSVQTRFFDASNSITDLGSLPQGTTFLWTFGDGTVASGQKVAHDFAAGGKYDVSLTVRLPNGLTDVTHSTVAVQDSHILSLGHDGIFHATENGAIIDLAKGAFASSAGIQINNTGVSASVARTHVADIIQAQDFDISLKLDADSKTSYGEVFRLHGSFITSVTTKGEVLVRAFPTIGNEIQLTSTGMSVIDLKSHDIDIKLHDGVLQLLVDGKVSAQAAFTGTLKTYGNLDLAFGNQWGQKNFYGDITAFDITAGEDHSGVVHAASWTV